MIHFAQYPTVKVPVKLNAVNFDGVFNNFKVFQEQPSPNTVGQQQQKQGLGAIVGSSIAGVGIGGPSGSDMQNLIHVSSLNMGPDGHPLPQQMPSQQYSGGSSGYSQG